MIDLFFSDDAQQSSPSRPGMGPLVATGYLHVPGEAVRDLEQQLDNLCARSGFPQGRAGQFKWSPGRELWMREGLTGEARSTFYGEALKLAEDLGTKAGVVVCDTSRSTATGGTDHQLDVTKLLIERVEWRLAGAARHGIIIADRPTGDRESETMFLAACLETISAGTRYVRPERIAFNVVSSPSFLVRCLQLADVVVSCTTSYVAGEDRYSPAVFDRIRPMLHRDHWRIGGMGLKLHPDYVFANLYHWLVADSVWMKQGRGCRIPHPEMPYATSPMTA